MPVIYRKEDDTYYERQKVGNQTIELGMNFHNQNLHDRKAYFNVYITIFNKRKDMYSNMDKKAITGTNPIANALTAREMFKRVEQYLLTKEFEYWDEIVIFCTWVNNRRRDAYYKVLSRWGYDWGVVDGQKCIMKTFTFEDYENGTY